MLEERNRHPFFNKVYAQKVYERKPYSYNNTRNYGDLMKIDAVQVKKPFHGRKKEDPGMAQAWV